jgi:hypothetical protein
MSTLRITTIAASHIRSLRAQCSMLEAVASLQYDLGEISSQSDLANALRKGADIEEIRKLYANQQDIGRLPTKRQLVTAFYPRDQVPPESLVNLDGIDFCIPTEILESLSDCVLDLDQGQLCLRNSEGIIFQYGET